jgi:hypothetical protein
VENTSSESGIDLIPIASRRYIMVEAWHNSLGWIFNRIGNVFYRWNGGLEGLDKDNLKYHLMIWAWSNAYYHCDRVTGIQQGGE